MTEQQAIDAIEAMAHSFHRFYIPGFDTDDVMQFARLQAIELLGQGTYDGKRPLERFLAAHVRNRLKNLIRNKVRRNDPPCLKCHSGQHCKPEGSFCEVYAQWKKRNDAKASVNRPAHLSKVSEENECCNGVQSLAGDIETNEIKNLIDECLPIELRSDWLRMTSGVKVAKKRREEICEVVREILEDSGVEVPEHVN